MLKRIVARATLLGVLAISLLFSGLVVAGGNAPAARADGGCFSWNGIFIHASNCWGNGFPGYGYGYGGYPGQYYPPIVYPPPPPPPPPIPIGYPIGPCGC